MTLITLVFPFSHVFTYAHAASESNHVWFSILCNFSTRHGCQVLFRNWSQSAAACCPNGGCGVSRLSLTSSGRRVHSMVSWNLRGKALESIQEAWDLLDAQGVNFLFLQELGGQGGAAQPWDRLALSLKMGQQTFSVFVGSPHASSHLQATCISEAFVERAERLHAGLLVIVKRQGVRLYLFSLHLPHAQREDCIQVWEQTSEELDLHLSALKYHDAACIGADLNLEVCNDPMSI